MAQQRTQTQTRQAPQERQLDTGRKPEPPAQTNGHGAQIEKETIYVPFGEKAEVKLTLNMVRSLLCQPTKQGQWPSDAEVGRFIMVCKHRQLNPWVGDCWLLGYDTYKDRVLGPPKFSIVVAVQALMKRAELNKEFDGIESGIVVDRGGEIIERPGDLIVNGETLLGGYATVYRKDKSKPFYQRLGLAAYDKGTPQWKSDPCGMISKCFDEDTEVLTQRGFRRFADVDSPIMQVTDRGLEPTDAVPFAQDYSGPMIALDSDDLNFSVTPNHDMITTSGRMEAGEMFGRARSRAVLWIPRHAPTRTQEAAIGDDAIMLAAIYLADGYDRPRECFDVSVSRQRKLDMLRSIGGFRSHHQKRTGGKSVQTEHRVIATTADQTTFCYRDSARGGLVGRGKVVDFAMLSTLSRRQARIFVDTLLACDGHRQPNGVRRFYQTRPDIMSAFEIAAVIAGYAVSDRKSRTSDIGNEPNLCVTVSSRDAIGVRRWGRYYHYDRTDRTTNEHNGLHEAPNTTGRVWCVTVPSGVIVVRRRGFSMLCGNCAEAAALRQAFPSDIGGIYLEQELHSDPETLPAGEGKAATATPSARTELANRLAQPPATQDRVVGKAPAQQSPPEQTQARQEAQGEHDQTAEEGAEETPAEAQETAPEGHGVNQDVQEAAGAGREEVKFGE